jgi:predicted glycosyltransferase
VSNYKRQTISGKQRILVCPLDWGLGHASRCIPLIYAFLNQGHEVLLAGSGASAQLLQQEFPTLTFIPFESFTLRYSAGSSQIGAVLRAFPRLLKRIKTEQKELSSIVKSYAITQVVSDNRFGCYCKEVKSIYITHQLWVKLPSPFGFLEPLVARWHRAIIEKYDACWVPDYEEVEKSLAGKLSHPKVMPNNVTYIGSLSRFDRPEKQGELSTLTVAVLSGIEPQRSIFEQYLLDTLQIEPSDKVILVQGLPQKGEMPYHVGTVVVYPSLSTRSLEALLLKATHIICRSGYSSIMDLAALDKLSVTTFIPTPGQPEQEYLAWYLRTKKFG